jgi:SAM-dependent methyltransferase
VSESLCPMPEWAAPDLVERRPEPLGESAPLAAAWAETHCRVDPASGASCRGYHAKWQRKRLEGRDLGLGNDGPPLAAMIRGLARRGALRRILVCGSADYGLLALAADAIDARPVPSVTVLDLCETPLLLNRWFADRRGLSIETIHADALDFRPEQPYDLILAHTLLGFFEEAGRRRLLARWLEILAPGGRVLISHPLDRASRPGTQRPANAVPVEEWRQDGPPMQFKLAALEDLATPFAAAGFEVEAALAARRPPKTAGGVPGLWHRLTRGTKARRKPRGRDCAIVLARRPTA